MTFTRLDLETGVPRTRDVLPAFIGAGQLVQHWADETSSGSQSLWEFPGFTTPGSIQTTPQVKGGLSLMLSRTFKGCALWCLLQEGLRESCLGVDKFGCVFKWNVIYSYCKGRTAYWATKENAQDCPWRSVNAETSCNVSSQQQASGHLWVWVSMLEGEI